MISHLTVNQHALSQSGLPAFREMLALYDLPHSPISRRQIEGITDLLQAATVAWMRHKHGAALVRGTEMRMTLDENDFSGPLVAANGLQEKHKEDFLFSARGVPMQGTGKDSDGRYIALAQLLGGWHRNSRGAPDRVASQTGTSFRHVQSVQGKYGPVTENHSIAVDTSIIPARAKVDIEGVGTRYADDKGSAIQTYHIDNFLGAGAAVVKAWMLGGVNGTRRQVKYLGAE